MTYKRRILIVIAIVLFLGLILSKNLKINTWYAKNYDVFGIDVSHYQGEIDWKKMQEQNLDFAYIKATEGSSYVDEYFSDNWQKTGQTKLYIGAYHFFSFDSAAESQADLYIETVGELSGKLAPVVDIEYYGNKESNPPATEETVKKLKKLLVILEEHYKVKPIIYTTYKVYNKYIKDEFTQYPLWIRNVYYPPDIDIGRWTFWQYTDTAVLDGYDGDEKYIDKNIFYGGLEELRELIVE